MVHSVESGELPVALSDRVKLTDCPGRADPDDRLSATPANAWLQAAEMRMARNMSLVGTLNIGTMAMRSIVPMVVLI
jgi:hypothetical protein